jgi:hypothetical protein
VKNTRYYGWQRALDNYECMPIMPLCLTEMVIDIQATKSIVKPLLSEEDFVERAAVSFLEIIFRNEEEVLDKQGMVR